MGEEKSMRIILDGKPTSVKGSPKSGAELLRNLGISPQEALLKIEGKVRPEGAAIGRASKIEIIRVVFGG